MVEGMVGLKILTPAEIERKRIQEGIARIKDMFDSFVRSKEGAKIPIQRPEQLEEGVKNSAKMFRESGWEVSIITERIQSREIKENKFLWIIETKEIIPTEIKKYYLVFEPIKKGKK